MQKYILGWYLGTSKRDERCIVEEKEIEVVAPIT